MRVFRFPITLLVALILTALSSWSCGSEYRGETLTFDLPSLGRGSIDSSEFAGMILVAEFWATWCGPCRIQSEVLEGMRQEFSDRGVQVVSVNVGESPELVRAFAEKNPSSFPIVLDRDHEIAARYQIQAFPSFIVTDRSGRITDISAGVHSKARVRRLIDKADAASEPS